MADAVRVGSAARIHAPLASATLANASLWLTYGLYINDVHMVVPQAIGVACAAAQVAIVLSLRGDERPAEEGARR